MKSMGKVSRGKGFLGVLKYNLGKGKGEIIGGTMGGNDVLSLAQEFKEVAALRSDIEKPVWHQALRLPEGEVISKEKFTSIAEAYMKKMGLENHQYVLILDNLKQGQHVHIVANRIAIGGSLYLGKNENLASSRICGELEAEFDLLRTKQSKSSKKRAKAKPKKNEIEKALRTGEKPLKIQIQDIIDQILTKRMTLEQFKIELNDFGVQMIATTNKNGLVGFRFALNDTDIWFKGSQLGKDYSKNKLLEKGLIDEIREQNAKSKQTTTESNSNKQSDRNVGNENDGSNGKSKRNNRSPDRDGRPVGILEEIGRELEKASKRKGSSLGELAKQESGNNHHREVSRGTSSAYGFFNSDFVTNAEFGFLVKFHDKNTKETTIDTGYFKGIVKGNEKSALALSDNPEKNAHLLLNYSNLRGWKTITTGSESGEFLFHLEDQAWRMKPSLTLELTDKQKLLIEDYKTNLDSGLNLH